MRKSVVLLYVVLFLLIIFWAPWTRIDEGEDLLESRFFRGREGVLFKKQKPNAICDGSCMGVSWFPFGSKVDAESYDWYFISFWGQYFYINGE